MKKLLFFVSWSFFLLLLVAGLFGEGKKEEAVGAKPAEKVLTVGIAGDVETLDPNFSRYPIANMVNLNIYDQFFRYGTKETGEGYVRSDTSVIQGAAIESWEVSPDRMKLTMHVRKGVKFVKSGNEMTADDIVYWYNKGVATKSGILWNIQTGNIKSFEKTDPYTVVVSFEYPMQPMFFMLGRDQAWGVIDSKEAQKHATKEDPWANNWLAKNDAGAGEFYVESWEPGVQVVLAANKQYWAGAPYFDKVILKVIPSSATRALLLKQGAIDIALDMSPDELNELRNAPGCRVLSIPSRTQIPLQLNCSKPPFDNKLVRQAMGYLIPYDTIVKDVFSGRALYAKSPQPSLGQGFNPSFWPYSYDVNKAKELLAKAGYPQGFSFNLSIRSGVPVSRTLAVVLKDSMSKAGVTLNISEVPPPVFAEQEAKGTYDANVWGGGYLLYVDDPWYTMRAYLSDSATNRSHYKNPEVDQIYQKLRSEFNPQERKKLIDRWQQIILEDAPKHFLAEVPVQYAMRDDIKGFKFLEDSLVWFYPLHR